MIEILENNTIIMTRGDSLDIAISILKSNGEEYEPSSNDRIIFTAKESYDTNNIAIRKDISPETLRLRLEPKDTKRLKMPATYYYDIQLITSNGDVDTFITNAKLMIKEEVG